MGVWISRGYFISLLYKACAVSLYTILVREVDGRFVTLFFNMSQNDLKRPNRILLIFSAIHIKSLAFRFANPTIARLGMIIHKLTVFVPVQKRTDTMLPTKGKYSFFSYGTQVTMDLSTLMINIQFSHLIQKINGFSHFTQS